MLNILKSKLLITFLMVTVVGGVSIMVEPIFDNEKSIIRKAYTTNIKEDNTKETQTDSKKENENNSKKESASLISEKSNNNDTKKQENNISKKGNSNNETNTKKATSSKIKNTNNKTSTVTQTSTNNTSQSQTTTIDYDRTTTIYANDNITLLRVEYYKNNKLTYYSVVEQYDSVTKSYTEKIYKCNLETNNDPLIRTDVYSNGILIKSY